MIEHRQIIQCVKRPGYIGGLEQFTNDVTLVHLTVTGRWTKELRKAVRKDIDTLFEMHGGPLHIVTSYPHDGDVAKHAKLCALMGFKFDRTITDEHGIERPVYIRTE